MCTTSGRTVDRTEPAPLVVLFHGRGELPHVQLHYWKEAADQAGLILLVPKGTRRIGSVYAWEHVGATATWQVDDRQAAKQTAEWIKQLKNEFAISDILLAGFSQGGVVAFSILSQHADAIPAKGGILFATAFPDRPSELTEADRNQLPGRLVLFSGREDQWHEGNLAMSKHLQQMGCPVDLRVWEGGHDMPPEHSKAILKSVREILEPETRIRNR